MVISTRKFLAVVISVLLIFIVVFAAIDKKRMNEYKSQNETSNKIESANEVDQQSPFKTIERVEPISIDTTYEVETEMISNDTTLEEVNFGDENYLWITEEMLIGSWSTNVESLDKLNVTTNPDIIEFYYGNDELLHYYDYGLAKNVNFSTDPTKWHIWEVSYGCLFSWGPPVAKFHVSRGTGLYLWDLSDIDKGTIVLEDKYSSKTYHKISDDRVCEFLHSEFSTDEEGNELPLGD